MSEKIHIYKPKDLGLVMVLLLVAMLPSASLFGLLGLSFHLYDGGCQRFLYSTCSHSLIVWVPAKWQTLCWVPGKSQRQWRHEPCGHKIFIADMADHQLTLSFPETVLSERPTDYFYQKSHILRGNFNLFSPAQNRNGDHNVRSIIILCVSYAKMLDQIKERENPRMSSKHSAPWKALFAKYLGQHFLKCVP